PDRQRSGVQRQRQRRGLQSEGIGDRLVRTWWCRIHHSQVGEPTSVLPRRVRSAKRRPGLFKQRAGNPPMTHISPITILSLLTLTALNVTADTPNFSGAEALINAAIDRKELPGAVLL